MDAWRLAIDQGFSGRRQALAGRDGAAFARLALECIDRSIALNQRPDGLYHAYNLMRLESGRVEIDRLDVMLEGQVAVLNSGFLSPGQCLSVLQQLRQSTLYRPDQNSYLLYPDRQLPGFLDRNRLSAEVLADNAWARHTLDSGHNRYLVRDVRGEVHFAGRFRNATELAAELRDDPDVGPQDAAWLLDSYEKVFRHKSFTGRSGSMYKYEGLGCIYWHMVSKLGLAVAETAVSAQSAGAPAKVVGGLVEQYRNIREGLGLHKPPARYGAFPTDPYSHTPGFAGVQQPGLTGQVKEDIIARFVELGVKVVEGQVRFAPVLLARHEFSEAAYQWAYTIRGEFHSESLPAGSMAFCLYGVPVVYLLADKAGITVETATGEQHTFPGDTLDMQWSQALFWRDGRVARVIVDVPRQCLR